MLQNQQQQGLILEDHQALGMMGFFSNPSSNSLAFLHPHHHEADDPFVSYHHHHQTLSKPFASVPSEDGDADVDDDDDDRQAGTSINSTDLSQALLISSANRNPRNIHQDPSSLMGPVLPHIFSLQRPNLSNPWELRSSGSECLVSKRSFNGDSEPSLEEHDSVNATNDNLMDKKSLLGVSALRMKKMKGRRKVREPRFCFKTLSDVDVLDDGYKWRKYGQKVVKNTQHPRSYYRCTQDKCRVKKRVERLAEDPRMVITTYEGRHVHSPSHDNPDEDSNNGLPTLNNFFW